MRPAGFIVLDGGGADYRPIRQPVAALVVPLAVVAAVTATRIVGISLREARRRRRRAGVRKPRGPAFACSECGPEAQAEAIKRC
ncbi:hypothetical protein BJF83_14790 [Nocardiopsis sp. CNR-923]|nr:hypothetical protein BJF83_14790 [Nocardiopsis sp. CNR-923]